MADTMMTCRCPHCGQITEVDARTSGQVLNCPGENCGKQFRTDPPVAEPVPSLIVPGSPDDPPAPQATPVAVPVDAREDEVRTVRLDLVRRYPFRCLGYGVVVLVAVAAAIYAGVQQSPYLAALFAGIAVVVAGRWVVWWQRVRSTALTITSKRCILETGLFTREATELNRKDIIDLQIYQGTINRLLNVGDLAITSDNGSKRQIVLMAVPDPTTVAGDLQPVPK